MEHHQKHSDQHTKEKEEIKGPGTDRRKKRGGKKRKNFTHLEIQTILEGLIRK